MMNTLEHLYHYANNREKNFISFRNNELEKFWETVKEDTFLNYRCQNLAFMHKCHDNNDKVIVLVTGRAESYFRYKEVIYDFFHEGYDVFCFDHIGQGLSDRLLADVERGYIDDFNHYVGDLIKTITDFFSTKEYKYKFAVAHSMGGGVLAHAILKSPNIFHAAVFCAPMFGMNIPLPDSLANNILNMTERHKKLRESYALGAGKWRALPFSLNRVTHSQVRYEYNIELLQTRPKIKIGGPTFHWVREAKKAASLVISKANEWTLPTLIMQAGKELLVCNKSQEIFVNSCHVKPEFIIYAEARHELLMEKDEIRISVLDNIFRFLKDHSQP